MRQSWSFCPVKMSKVEILRKKLLLVEMEEAGQALPAEDEYWCDHPDDEDQIPVTLMAKVESDDEDPVQMIRSTLMVGDESEDSQFTEDEWTSAQVSISDFELYKAQMLEIMDK